MYDGLLKAHLAGPPKFNEESVEYANVPTYQKKPVVNKDQKIRQLQQNEYEQKKKANELYQRRINSKNQRQKQELPYCLAVAQTTTNFNTPTSRREKVMVTGCMLHQPMEMVNVPPPKVKERKANRIMLGANCLYDESFPKDNKKPDYKNRGVKENAKPPRGNKCNERIELMLNNISLYPLDDKNTSDALNRAFQESRYTKKNESAFSSSC